MINITEDDIVQLAVEYFRAQGFPYVRLHDYEIYQIFKNLQDNETRLVRSEKGLLHGLVTSIGINECKNDQSLANHFHPHIWESKAYKMRSPIESFAIDKSLQKVMRLCLKYLGEITIRDVRTFLRTVNGTQCCSNFRPSAAKAVYDYFKAENVLDMSAGYGGRLLGFLASKSTGTYTGVDPSERTINCNQAIVDYFKQNHRVRLIQSPFEDATDLPKVDFAFTSPPYFKKEVYDGDDEKQSSNRYQSYDAWRDNFLAVMIQKVRDVLLPDGTMAINIQDVRINNVVFPTTDDTVQVAQSNGFIMKERLDLSLSSFGRGLKKTKSEPIFIFKKA